jgi:hypothetical protein
MKLSLHHLQELQSAGPKFVKIMQNLIDNAGLAGVAAESANSEHPSLPIKSRRETHHG